MRAYLLGLLALTSCNTLDTRPTTHIGPVTAVVFAAGRLTSCSQAGIKVDDHWVITGFRPLDLAVHNNHILVGGGLPAQRGNLAWLTRRGEVIAEQVLAPDLVYTVAIAPDGRTAAAGCADGTVHLLSLPSLETIRSLPLHTAPVRALEFAADGTTLASAALDGLVQLYDLDSGNTQTFTSHTAGVESLHYRGDLLYSGARDGKVRVHNNTRLVRTYQGLRQPVIELIRVDGMVLAGLASGDVVRLDNQDDGFVTCHRFEAPLFALAKSTDRMVAGSLGRLLENIE